MLKQRLLTVAVVLPLLLGCIFLLPNSGWALLMTVPTALGAFEWGKLAGYGRGAGRLFVGAVSASCLLGIAISTSQRHPDLELNIAMALFALALLFWAVAVPVWLYSKWRIANALLLAVAGWVVLVPAWLAVVRLQKEPWLLLVVLGVVWIADTAAYFAGRRFGRNKLAPQISPGKTWEGVTGAYIAVLIYAFAASLIVQPSANGYDHLGVLLFACVLTAFGIVGDLFESWIKRQAGAKDSGQLLPGHGGVLDRIDSLTAALPFAALYFIEAAWSA